MYGEDFSNDTADWCDKHSDSRSACDCRARGADGLLQAIRSGAWLHEQHFDPVRFAIPHLIPEGYTVLVGGPKLGKSWLMLDGCLAIAEGGLALGGIPVERGVVLYLALEDGDRRLQDRIRKLRGTGPIADGFHYATTIERGQVLNTISAWLEQHPDTRLIVLDTLGKVLPPALRGETTYERDYRIGSALKQIVGAHPGLALVVVHHDRKAKTADFVEAVSGTNGAAGAADTIVALSRERHSPDGVVAVTGRDVKEADFAITLRDGLSWQLLGGSLDAARGGAQHVRQEVRAASLGGTMQELVDFVKRTGNGVRAQSVADSLGITKAKAAVYLKRAAEAGLIDRLERGVYGPVLSISPVVMYEVLETEGTSNTYDITTAVTTEVPVPS